MSSSRNPSSKAFGLDNKPHISEPLNNNIKTCPLPRPS